MAKKNQKPAQQAPAAPQENVETIVPENVSPKGNPATEAFLNTLGINLNAGLDPNHQVELLSGLDRHFMKPGAAAAYGLNEDTVQDINRITAIGWVTVLATEVTTAKNPFALKLSQAQLKEIVAVSDAVGINLNTTLLPPPSAEGTVEIPSTAIEVSPETKKKIKEEAQIANNAPELDPTKFKNDDDLKNAVVYTLVHNTGGYEKISESIALVRSYLSLKNKDNAEELEKVKNMTNREVLTFIKDLVGKCPYVLNSMGHFMFTITSGTKSPISAFCMFRKAATNRKTGVVAISDQEVADYVHVIVTWASEVAIAEATDAIANYEKNLKVLAKDKKANEKAIEDINKKIAAKQESIKHYKEAIEFIEEPTSDVPDNLIENYKQKDQVAMKIFKSIVDTYLGEYDITTLEMGGVYTNVAQYAGIIHNLFRNPLTQLEGYSIANLVDLKPTAEEVAKAEEATEEDGSKK